MSKLHLVTGYMGEEHIQSSDQGSFNASFFGGGEYVMEAGNQFEASIMDNNTVRILDGDALMKGRHLRIKPNTYADMTITTGTAGVNRNDLIVFQYSKDTSTGVEASEIVVIKGTETEGTAADPEYTDGDILAGATFNQMPMYRVKVEGVVLVAIEPLFTVIPTYKKLAEQYARQFQEACDTYIGLLNILDTIEEVEANTQEGQLAGALSVKELASKKLSLAGGTMAGTLNSQNVYPVEGSRYHCGETDKPFAKVHSNHFDAMGSDGSYYAQLTATVQGTADTLGIGDVWLGNSIPQGKAGNARGRIVLFNANSAYSVIQDNDAATASRVLTLPKVTGQIPVAAVSGTTLYISY